MVAGFVLVAIVTTIMLESYVRSMLYPAPPFAVPAAPSPLQEVALRTARGDDVVDWYAATEGARAQVLYLHGNGENLATVHLGGTFGELARLGLATLAVDYPGYGRSSGVPSQEGNVAAAVAACRWLIERDASAPTILMGWSLGAAVAAQTAAACAADLDAVILASAWKDLATTAADHFPGPLVRALMRERYDSAAALAEVKLPVLVIHGGRDDLIAARHGRALAEALTRSGREVTWKELPAAGHNDLLAFPEFWRAVGGWLDSRPELAAAASL